MRDINPFYLKARRTRLQKYEIDNADGTRQAEIVMPKGVWIANGAPLAGAFVNTGLANLPVLTVLGDSHPIYRDLLTNNLLTNYYSIYLLDNEGRKIIETKMPIKKRDSWIAYQDAEFLVSPRSLFAFNYELTSQKVCIARFKDISPFFTVSARRHYEIETRTAEIEPLLLAFAFFLAVSGFY